MYAIVIVIAGAAQDRDWQLLLTTLQELRTPHLISSLDSTSAWPVFTTGSQEGHPC